MTNPSETVLQNALLANMKRAETVLQADFSREIGLIEKNGALRFLQQLSAEAVVVRPEFSTLFTDDEVNCCFDRLCSNGYYSR